MSDEEIIAMLDSEQAHIDAIRKSIEARRANASTSRLKGDGIHPGSDTTTDGEA